MTQRHNDIAQPELPGVAVQAACDAAADAIAALSPSAWAGWVIYLLEILDDRGTEADFRWILEGVTEAIEGRLELGRW